jgi:NAD(P)-dependent dehydrogenase (short-subunit alcohol dehydrogenase family)
MHTSPTPTVVISGASKGIGRATALHLDAIGFRVFAGVRTEKDAHELRAAASERLEPVQLDVTSSASVASAAESIREEAPTGLAGIVNNAGIVVPGPLECLPLDRLREQLEVNVIGVLAVTQAFMPAIRTGHGRVVNVSSLNGRVASPFAGAYAISKFGLEGLSDALRMELRHWGIPVVVIQPGAVETPIWETSARRAAAIAKEIPDEGKKLYGRVMTALTERAARPPKRAIPPARVARVVAHALTTRRPKTRYRVGRDARLATVLAAVLPDRLIDRLLTK